MMSIGQALEISGRDVGLRKFSWYYDHKDVEKFLSVSRGCSVYVMFTGK